MITCKQWDPPVDMLGLLKPFACCAGLRQSSETRVLQGFLKMMEMYII